MNATRKRTARITIRLNPRERALLEQAAEAAYLSPSEWVRAVTTLAAREELSRPRAA